MNKLVVILGPTASGKSALAIKLAKKFHGEIVSADSRQVYKGLDIGTGKMPISHGLRSKTSIKSSIPAEAGIYSKGIRHHLLDVVSPKKQFSVAQYKQLAKNAVAKIVSREKIPFLVGGSPFYIYSLIDDLQIPEIKPNLLLRKQLAKKSADELFQMLKKLDSKRAKNIDRYNPRRLIRAIEIVKSTNKPVPVILSGAKDLKWDSSASPQNDKILILGIKKDQNRLYKLIDKRLEQRLKQGLVAEVKKLLRQKISHKKLQELGLEYRFVSLYLQGHLTYEQMVSLLKNAIHKFSKRQMTWFKKDKRIHWIVNQKQAEKLVKKYLNTI